MGPGVFVGLEALPLVVGVADALVLAAAARGEAAPLDWARPTPAAERAAREARSAATLSHILTRLASPAPGAG